MMNNVNILTNEDNNIVDNQLRFTRIISISTINCLISGYDICLNVYIIGNSQTVIKEYIDEKYDSNLFA